MKIGNGESLSIYNLGSSVVNVNGCSFSLKDVLHTHQVSSNLVCVY